MLSLFCLRLAAGMLFCLLLLPTQLVNPRYCRTHFLTAGCLVVLAWYFLPASLDWEQNAVWAASVLICLAGSVVWWLDRAPGGRAVVCLSTTLLAVLLVGQSFYPKDDMKTAVVLAGNLTSSLVLGAAMSAMLMGHSYLISPSMSLTPLLRLLALLGIALLARAAEEGGRLLWWTRDHSFASLENDTLLWLPVRWAVGLVLPVILGWMAWQSARIRSTQSATGILYVVVIFCFVGELTSLLLRGHGVTL